MLILISHKRCATIVEIAGRVVAKEETGIEHVWSPDESVAIDECRVARNGIRLKIRYLILGVLPNTLRIPLNGYGFSL